MNIESVKITNPHGVIVDIETAYRRSKTLIGKPPYELNELQRKLKDEYARLSVCTLSDLRYFCKSLICYGDNKSPEKFEEECRRYPIVFMQDNGICEAEKCFDFIFDRR